MTDHDKHDKRTPRHGERTDDPKRPSQAEGDRETVEEALGEQARGQSGTARGKGNTSDPERPSQAEGERGMNTKDLRDRSHRGPS